MSKRRSSKIILQSLLFMWIARLVLLESASKYGVFGGLLWLKSKQSEGHLPGCDVEKSGGKKLFHQDDSVPEAQKVPRLRPINRNQMILHPVDVERLSRKTMKSAPSGSLSVPSIYRATMSDIDSLEGEAGAPAFDPRLLISLWVYAYSKGVSFSPRDRPVMRV